MVHAELNACLQAGKEARGCTIYVYPGFSYPCLCHVCAGAVIQKGIIRAVGLIRNGDEELAARWKESLDIAAIMIEEAEIEVCTYNEI